MAKFTPSRVIIHNSDTKDSGTVSWGAIRHYHTHVKKWRGGIGYHAGCELVLSGQEVYYEVLMGRMWNVQAAHCRGHNRNSLGFCFIGDFEKTVPSQRMIQAGAKVIALWLDLFGLTTKDIYPHSYFDAYKTCPGTFFDMALLKRAVALKMRG